MGTIGPAIEKNHQNSGLSNNGLDSVNCFGHGFEDRESAAARFIILHKDGLHAGNPLL
jgi:hypothetical protein